MTILKALRIRKRSLFTKSHSTSPEELSPEGVDELPANTVASGALSVPDILLCIANALDSDVDLFQFSLCNQALYATITPLRLRSVDVTADKLWSLSLLLRRKEFARSCRALKVCVFLSYIPISSTNVLNPSRRILSYWMMTSGVGAELRHFTRWA